MVFYTTSRHHSKILNYVTIASMKLFKKAKLRQQFYDS